MSRRPRAYSNREFERILKCNGYKYKRSKGDHNIYSNGKDTISVTATRLNKLTALKIIKEHNLNVNMV